MVKERKYSSFQFPYSWFWKILLTKILESLVIYLTLIHIVPTVCLKLIHSLPPVSSGKIQTLLHPRSFLDSIFTFSVSFQRPVTIIYELHVHFPNSPEREKRKNTYKLNGHKTNFDYDLELYKRVRNVNVGKI